MPNEIKQIKDVLSEGYAGMQWGLLDNPKSEAEFEEYFVLHDLAGHERPIWSDLQSKLVTLQSGYDALEYSRLRELAYRALNQLEMQFDDQRDSTTTWVDAVNAIKAKYPKPS